jgi:hypothetical protein
MLQLELPFSVPQTQSLPAEASPGERGAVYTRREVVEFILDLVGYTQERDLWECRLLEPSIGNGSFLWPSIQRLLASYQRRSGSGSIVQDLGQAVRAVEIHGESMQKTRRKLHELLVSCGLCAQESSKLLEQWLVEGDFLLADLPMDFTHVVGNPPYVRQELIPDRLMAEYRRRYRTIYDRADLYIPFIERCLCSLAGDGVLGFICSDRWMKNRYGKKLRGLVSSGFHLEHYVDMVDTEAFESDVAAYPAVTVIRRGAGTSTNVAARPKIDNEALSSLARAMNRNKPVPTDARVQKLVAVVNGQEPWVLDPSPALLLVRRLESAFASLEEVGCRVGIGVATGADRAFIGPFAKLDVEDDRKLPLLRTRDIRNGQVEWHGDGVINPFSADGGLVDLDGYPRLRRYLSDRSETIRGRSCARRNPAHWYRTIDRIDPALVPQEKLLIPDIKGTAHIVHESGGYYPHHNLYYITSSEWPLLALQAVLMSGIAKLFVSAYSTEMRGGFLRFQAQYLRRIRLPEWCRIPKNVRNDLLSSTDAGDRERTTKATCAAYGLSPDERGVLLTHIDEGET